MVCPLNIRGVFGDEFKKASKILVKARNADGMLREIEAHVDMHYEDFE